MMALDHPLKSLAFAYADNIDKFFAVENVDQHPVAGLHSAVAFGFFLYFDWNFADKFHRRNIVLAEMTLHRLGQARLFYEFHQANLRRIVAISSLRLVLRDHARTRLQDRRRTHIAL